MPLTPSVVKKFRPFTAPKRWTFVDPDTGYEYKSFSRQQLFQHIINYRIQNQLPPIPHLDVVMENYLCGLPENIGKCRSTALRRGFLQTIRGGVALLENVFYGKDNLAPQETAEKRAEICVDCPENVFPDRGAFITWSDQLAEASTGGRRTKLHDKLGNCAVCSCPLRAKVHYGGEIKLTDDEISRLPDFCWQKPLAIANSGK